MADYVYHGSREEFRQRLRDLPGVLSGRLPDTTGAARSIQLAIGTALLGRASDNFVRLSEGGVSEITGEPWPALSPVTLALRRKDSSEGKVIRLVAGMPRLSPHRQRLIETQYQRLRELYEAPEEGRSTGTRARRHARRLLRLLRPHLAPTRYRKLESELRGRQRSGRAYRLAMSGAFALILRDTNRLLTSLSPIVITTDQVKDVGPGFVTVGTNVDYAKYHQSNRPRRLKRDGSPRLPRRQFLPDDGQMPQSWWDTVTTTLSNALHSPAFLQQYLSGGAA